MNKALQRYLEAATGLTNLTAAKAEQVVKGLVRSGEDAGEQVGDLVEDLLERQKRNREAVTALVKSETTRAVRAMGLATGKQVERLQKQVVDLKRELSRVERATGTEDAARAASPSSEGARTTGKKAASKKTTKKAASKKTAKKAASKKTAKKTASKKTAKKTAVKKAAKKVAKGTSAGGSGARAGGPPPEASPVLAEEVRDLTDDS